MKDNRKIFNWFANLGEWFLKWQSAILPAVGILLVIVFAVANMYNESAFFVSVVIIGLLSALTGFMIGRIMSGK